MPSVRVGISRKSRGSLQERARGFVEKWSGALGLSDYHIIVETGKVEPDAAALSVTNVTSLQARIVVSEKLEERWEFDLGPMDLEMVMLHELMHVATSELKGRIDEMTDRLLGDGVMKDEVQENWRIALERLCDRTAIALTRMDRREKR